MFSLKTLIVAVAMGTAVLVAPAAVNAIPTHRATTTSHPTKHVVKKHKHKRVHRKHAAKHTAKLDEHDGEIGHALPAASDHGTTFR